MTMWLQGMPGYSNLIRYTFENLTVLLTFEMHVTEPSVVTFACNHSGG